MTITIPALGAYRETWPVDCPKTGKIAATAAERSMALLAEGKGLNRTTAMHAMFLLSTGEDAHLEAVRKMMHASVPEMRQVKGHTWSNGYVRSGLVNAAGGGLFTGIVLARECGIAKYFRHYNPVVRCQAACAIGYHGDKALPEIEKAIRSKDARVRQAGLRGLSGYMTFFMNKSPFLRHDEWWLRTGAFLAICETGADAAPMVPQLIECFVREQHGWPREFYHRVLKTLLREDKPQLTSKTREQVLQLLGDDIVGGNYPRDHAYTMRGNWFYEHRNSHVLTSFGPDALVLVADQVNQVLANMGDPKMVEGREGGVALWILNGDKWGGEGLLNIIETMDENDRAAFMPGLKALLAGGLDAMCGSGSGKKAKTNAEPLKIAKDKAQAMLGAYEKNHSKVEPFPAKRIDYDGTGE